MKSDIEDYLSSYTTSRDSLSDDEFVDVYYERRISEYRSSTLLVYESWGETLIVCGEEFHYEEFI